MGSWPSAEDDRDGPHQTDCSPPKMGGGGLVSTRHKGFQVSPLPSDPLLDIHCCHLFKACIFPTLKTTPDTQSLMCSHKCQEREEQTSALPGRTAVSCGLSQCGRPWGGTKQRQAHDPSRRALHDTRKNRPHSLLEQIKAGNKVQSNTIQINPQESPTTRTA